MAQTKSGNLLIKAAASAAIALAVIAVVYWLSGRQVLAPTVSPAATGSGVIAPLPPKPVCELGEPDLFETGWLNNKNEAAAEPGTGWSLVYKKLRKPLQFAPLCFAEDSLCRFGAEFQACDLTRLGADDDVRIEGHKNVDGTYGVVRLLLIKKAAAAEPAP
ncbi:MAG: hypothetical protein WCT10_00985 [Patescibacteria group bacterium]|jgi:hypothetical protein